MERNHVVIASIAAGSVALGGIGGYLLAAHRLQGRFDRDLAELKAHYVAKAEELERDGVLGQFRVVPGRAASVGTSGIQRGLGGDVTVRGDQRPDYADSVHDGSGIAEGEDPGAERLEPGTDGAADGIEDPELEGESDEAESEVEFITYEDGPEAEVDRAESDKRGPGPYVISEAEFFTDNETYQKLSIMYYQKDKVLVDDKDAPIPDIKKTVGNDFLAMFGVDENNPHIVYVRNDHLEVDFEIALDYDAYAGKVLGYGVADPKRRGKPRG